MFNKKISVNILKCYTDSEGRFIIVDVETEEKILTLVNIYPSNRAKLMHHLTSLKLFIWNFLTCLEEERRFSLKNGFLAKFNKKNGELSSLN